MAATVYFKATQSGKYLRIWDNLDGEDPVAYGYTKVNELLEAIVSTHGGSDTGQVRVEVSRDDRTWADHDPRMPVEDEETYDIDDSNLPAASVPTPGSGGQDSKPTPPPQD